MNSKERVLKAFEKIEGKPDRPPLHSDGAVALLIDDLIGMGIEVYNPVQLNVPGSAHSRVIVP